MIFIDANYFVQYFVLPTGPATRAMHEAATALFESVERGEVEATTSESVIAEVAFILASPNQFRLPPSDIAAFLAPVLGLRKLRLPRGQRRLWLRALEIWSAQPRLGFVDSLTAAYAENPNTELATFDGDFDRFAAIRRWHPPAPPSS